MHLTIITEIEYRLKLKRVLINFKGFYLLYIVTLHCTNQPLDRGKRVAVVLRLQVVQVEKRVD